MKQEHQIGFAELLEAGKEFHAQEDIYRPMRVKYAEVFHELQNLKAVLTSHMPALIPELDDLRRRAQKLIDEEVESNAGINT